MSNTKPEISVSLRTSLEEHLEKIREKILEEAKVISLEEDENTEISISHLARAIEGYAPIGKFTPKEKKEKLSFFDYFPPIALVSAILTIVFGALGIIAISANNPAFDGKGFLDIAKIFTGAVVGSTSTSAVSIVKRKR